MLLDRPSAARGQHPTKDDVVQPGTPVSPDKCTVMVGFNMASAGQDAEELTAYLNDSGIPTFCTAVWCNTQVGESWRNDTIQGVVACQIYVILMTNGWQKSNECVWETDRAINRHAKQEIKIIPVRYPDFDDVYDQADSSRMFSDKIGDSVQRVSRAQPDWKEQVAAGCQIRLDCGIDPI